MRAFAVWSFGALDVQSSTCQFKSIKLADGYFDSVCRLDVRFHVSPSSSVPLDFGGQSWGNVPARRDEANVTFSGRRFEPRRRQYCMVFSD
jgi:hypothetical protein